MEKALEQLISDAWLFVIKNQSFAFLEPQLACSVIEKQCIDQSTTGFSKIAGILVSVLPFMSIRLTADVKGFLDQLAKS